MRVFILSFSRCFRMPCFDISQGMSSGRTIFLRFALRTGAPFFYEQKGERFGFGPAAFQQEMLAKLERGEKLW